MTTVTVPATDGFSLAGTHVVPAIAPRAAVVIASATGVRRRYYEAFARFLATRGLATLAFDYRGIGESAPKETLKGFGARLRDWGERDLAGAIAWASEKHAGLPVLVVGHSVGGQIFGLAPNGERVKAVLTVASQSGYWRLWPWKSRLAMGLLWYAVIPTVTRAFGYLPMSATAGEDLPREVALEWARWGRHPRYVLGHVPGAGYEKWSGAWNAYAIADDSYAPVRAVEELLRYYPAARSSVRVVHPHEIGERAIGHFGFFRPKFKDALWGGAADWLLSNV